MYLTCRGWVIDMFRDRIDAGRELAELLAARNDLDDAVVLGIPRGGVIVAAEVAERLALPLDVVITSKIGAPGNPEYAVGAVDPDGIVTPNASAGFSMTELEHLGRPVKERIAARLEMYRVGRPHVEVAGRPVVACDDGIATGLTVIAAFEYLRRLGASTVIVAVPVAAPDSADKLRHLGAEVVAVEEPPYFGAVGQFYRRFGQTSDDEVLEALARAWRE
jgi:putative phosphoribosyl transferase